MPSPFPGMDPFLEDGRLWPDFHNTLVECLRETLQTALPPAYEVCVGERYIEILHRDGRLVTLLDVVSPANKNTRPICRHAETRLHRRRVDLSAQGKPTLSYSREGLPHFDYSVTVVRARYEIYTATAEVQTPPRARGPPTTEAASPGESTTPRTRPCRLGRKPAGGFVGYYGIKDCVGASRPRRRSP